MPPWRREKQYQESDVGTSSRARQALTGTSSVIRFAFFYVLPVLGLLGVAIIRPSPRKLLEAPRKALFPHATLAGVAGVPALNGPTTPPATPELLVDESRATTWIGQATTFTFSFKEPIDLFKVGFVIGDANKFAAFDRPHRIHVVVNGATDGAPDRQLSQHVLQDKFAFQTTDAEAKNVTRVTVVVDDRSGQTGKGMAISEIEFFERT